MFYLGAMGFLCYCGWFVNRNGYGHCWVVFELDPPPFTFSGVVLFVMQLALSLFLWRWLSSVVGVWMLMNGVLLSLEK